MPDVFSNSVTTGALFRKGVAIAPGTSPGAIATLVYNGPEFTLSGAATIFAFAPVTVGSPLLRKDVQSAPFLAAPLLPRSLRARRVSGLIWPRQFAGARPNNGLLIPRTRGSSVAFYLELDGQRVTLNGESITLKGV